MNWVGLISWIIAAICLSIIGVRRSIKYGALFHWMKPSDPPDVKPAQLAGLLFIAVVFFFILGAFVKK
jgi:hypothetical protein